MPLTQKARSHRLLAALVLAGLAIAAIWPTADDDAASSDKSRVSITTPPDAPGFAPEPRPTAPAELAATLRAQSGPPSPELLRDNPQAQAAYDASARPGDFVTPPSVSVEH